MTDDRIAKLTLLFLFSFLLFNFPLLSIFDHAVLQYGVPRLYFYLFSVWLLIILVIMSIVTRRDQIKPK